jgi:hypothetical protein
MSILTNLVFDQRGREDAPMFERFPEGGGSDLRIPWYPQLSTREMYLYSRAKVLPRGEVPCK